MAEKFCLKWNDFHSNVSKHFRLLRDEEYLHDVTLVCDDNHMVSVHKLVLSASSDYFKNIFKGNQHHRGGGNTLLCLDGVSSTDLGNILDYIYNGEVQIYQDDIDRFLQVAQRFKLDGLLGGDSETIKDDDSFKEFKYPNISQFEEVQTESSTGLMSSETAIQLNLDSHDLSEIDQKLNENMEKDYDGKYRCKVCSKTMEHRGRMKEHVEVHMDGLQFTCNICCKIFRSRNTLKNHKSLNHRNF